MSAGALHLLCVIIHKIHLMQLLTDLFAHNVALHPDVVAIDVPPGRERAHRQLTTYAQLDRAAVHAKFFGK